MGHNHNKVNAWRMTKIYHYQSSTSTNHGYGICTDQCQLRKSHDEGNMPQYKHLMCQRDKTDIVKWILSMYSGSIKHHHTKWKRNQMSLKAFYIRESMTTPILQPIVKTCPLKIVEDNVWSHSLRVVLRHES